MIENASDAKRIVVKVGTSTLAHQTGLLNIQRMERLTKVLSDLKNAGKEIILVSSGAIGVGAGKIGLKERPVDIPVRQACAAIGQCELMYCYDKYFSEYNHTVAQVLMTRDIIDCENRKTHVVNTLRREPSGHRRHDYKAQRRADWSGRRFSHRHHEWKQPGGVVPPV